MSKKIKNLGELNGDLLVFGGVYSNLQALEALKAEADKRNIPSSHIICTGDIAGYCAQPEECLQLIRKWGIHCIAGNVELNLREEADDCGCNFDEGGRCDLFSRQWYPYVQQKVSPDSLEWIKKLPEFLRFSFFGKKVAVVHGSFFNTSEFIFRSTPWEVKAANFEALEADIILAGHCGLPFAEEQGGRLWLNAGVIGMPANDGTSRVWYAQLSRENHTFEAMDYDFRQAHRLMKERPLPASYAQTLLTGIWDNCEILPAEETALQGKAIRF